LRHSHLHGSTDIGTGLGELVRSHGLGELVRSHGLAVLVRSHGLGELVRSHGLHRYALHWLSRVLVHHHGLLAIATLRMHVCLVDHLGLWSNKLAHCVVGCRFLATAKDALTLEPSIGLRGSRKHCRWLMPLALISPFLIFAALQAKQTAPNTD